MDRAGARDKRRDAEEGDPSWSCTIMKSESPRRIGGMLHVRGDPLFSTGAIVLGCFCHGLRPKTDVPIKKANG